MVLAGSTMTVPQSLKAERFSIRTGCTIAWGSSSVGKSSRLIHGRSLVRAQAPLPSQPVPTRGIGSPRTVPLAREMAQTTAFTMRMIRSRRSESNERWAGREASHGPT